MWRFQGRKKKEQNKSTCYGACFSGPPLCWIIQINLGFIFLLPRQEENRTEITHLKVGATMAGGQGKGECLYSVVWRIPWCEVSPLRPGVWQFVYLTCVSDLRGVSWSWEPWSAGCLLPQIREGFPEMRPERWLRGIGRLLVTLSFADQPKSASWWGVQRCLFFALSFLKEELKVNWTVTR